MNFLSSTMQSASQQLLQANKMRTKSAAISSYVKTHERLEEFIRYFVKESEAKLFSYHLVLEGELKRSGKFTQTFSKAIGCGIGGTAGIVAAAFGLPPTGAKVLSQAGKLAGKKISDKIGSEIYSREVRQLADFIELSQKSKATLRKALVETGFDIFQSFEMQFMGVSINEYSSNGMHVLAKDAINRAVNYLKKNSKSSSISECVILGESKRKDISSLRPGFSVTYKSQLIQITWNTGSLFSKVGLLRLIDNKAHLFKKKESDTGTYGYRRLLHKENWDALSKTYTPDNAAESKSGHFTNYDYQLNLKDMEVTCKSIFKKINADDKDLGEERIKEMLEEVKNDVLDEINILKTQSHEYSEDYKTFLAEIAESVKNFNSEEHVEKLKQYFRETKEEIANLIKESSEYVVQRIKEMSDDNKEQHGNTQAALEKLNIGMEMVQKEQKETKQTLQKIAGELIDNGKKADENDGKVRKQQRRNKDPIWFDMRESVESFTGRKNHLDQIVNYVKKGMVVITGLSGVGKTELAIKYAHTQYTRDDSVIWINAKNCETIKQSFYRLYRRLGFRIDEDGTEKDIKSICEDMYRHFSNQTSLFIFDDVETYTTIKDVLPRGLPSDANKPHVLITTQKLKVNRGMTLSLGDFTIEESMDFIKKIYIVKDVSQIGEVRDLAKKLHNFPLALQQAVAFISEEDKSLKNVGPEKDFTIRDYLEEFDRKTEELLKCKAFQELGNDYDKTTFTALQMTLNKIRNQKGAQQALEILNIMAYFSPDNIPASFFFELTHKDERKLGAAIQLLKDYSVVSGQGQLNMHGLVQQVMRLESVKEMGGGCVAEETILCKVLEMLKKYMTDFPTIQQYIPHIISVWNHASKYNALIDTFIVHFADDCVPYTTYFHVIVESSPLRIVTDILEKIEKNRPEEMSKIINQKCSTGVTPLYCAAASADEKKVTYLMSKGANVDVETKRKWRLLHITVKNGYEDTVRGLLEKGVDINSQTEYKFTPLHLAVKGEHVEITNLLLSRGASVTMKTSRGFTPLHLAVITGNVDIVQALLSHKASLKDKSRHEYTPLHLAAKDGRVKVLHVLLQEGAAVDAKTRLKFTPLHFAAQQGRLSIVEALLSKKAAVNAKDQNHFTPLHLAALNGHDDVVLALLKYNAEVNAKTTDGNTPLHFAMEKEHFDVASTLIENKADFDTVNNKGKKTGFCSSNMMLN